MNELDDLFTTPTDDDTLTRLHRRLEHAAESEGLLDVAYRTVDSPVGTLLLAATPRGLVRVAYDVEDHDRVLEMLAGRISPRVLRAPGRLDAYSRARRITRASARHSPSSVNTRTPRLWSSPMGASSSPRRPTAPTPSSTRTSAPRTLAPADRTQAIGSLKEEPVWTITQVKCARFTDSPVRPPSRPRPSRFVLR